MKTQRDWLVKSDGAAVAIWNPDDEHELWRKESSDPVFDAAAAILAPDLITENLVIQAIDDPEAFVDADTVVIAGSLDHQAQAVLAALKQRAISGDVW